MANGEDRNWIRLCITLDGFQKKYGRWPTRVRLGRGELDDLRDHLFTPKGWARVASKLTFIADSDVGFAAEGESDVFRYGDERGEIDFERVAWWLGKPDRNDDAPRFVEKVAFTVEGNPFDFE